MPAEIQSDAPAVTPAVTNTQPYEGTDYTVEIDAPSPTTRCICGSCEWAGTFADLAEIEECSLTPGDGSPAGRCPADNCDALAYVDTAKTRLMDASDQLLKAAKRALIVLEGLTQIRAPGDTIDELERAIALAQPLEAVSETTTVSAAE